MERLPRSIWTLHLQSLRNLQRIFQTFYEPPGGVNPPGSFDESKPIFANAERETASPAQPIEQGDLPDWVKAMAPQQSVPTPPAAEQPEEEMPDWINKIGTSALPLPSKSTDQPDWMSQTEQPAAQPPEDQPDWLKQLETPQQPVASSEDQPDWLKGFESETEATSVCSIDWRTGLAESSCSEESKPLKLRRRNLISSISQ